MNARPTRNFLITLMALAIAGCDSMEPDVTGVDPATGSIRVEVTRPESSEGVITILLSGPEGFLKSAPLSPGGAVTFSGLEPGAYVIGTAVVGYDCPSVSASVLGNQTTPANIACVRKTFLATGNVTGLVMGGDAPIGGASATLAAFGFQVTRQTAPSGHLAFAHIPAGEYTLSVSHRHFTCPDRTIVVAPPAVTTADVTCSPKATGALAGIVIQGDNLESRVWATVELAGPTAATTGPVGSDFEFVELEPGTYTLAATAFAHSCPAVRVEVQAARTTTVQIRCKLRGPNGSELAGGWEYVRVDGGQSGICPAVLPATGSGSVEFNAANRMIALVGLDPALAIVGLFDEGSGMYTGSGAATLGDGSTIQSDVTIRFDWDYWGGSGLPLFYTDSEWTRRHRDPSGTLVCTEVYGAGGYRVY